jgi:hypothetical protein
MEAKSAKHRCQQPAIPTYTRTKFKLKKVTKQDRRSTGDCSAEEKNMEIKLMAHLRITNAVFIYVSQTNWLKAIRITPVFEN